MLVEFALVSHFQVSEERERSEREREGSVRGARGERTPLSCRSCR
jgi:hypothetical protein